MARRQFDWRRELERQGRKRRTLRIEVSDEVIDWLEARASECGSDAVDVARGMIEAVVEDDLAAHDEAAE